MADLVIEAGKFYRTRGGYKVEIYSTDNGYLFPFHGAIEFFPSEKAALNWDFDFKPSESIIVSGKEFGVESMKIISTWCEPPVVDWDSLPNHIMAVAKDGDKRWYGFTTDNIEIKQGVYSGEWEPCEPLHAKIRLTNEVEFAGNWQDSLSIRPGYEPT